MWSDLFLFFFRQQIENWSKVDWPLHRVFIFCRNCNAFNHICFPCWRTISANVNLKLQKLVFFWRKNRDLITFVPALNHFCRRQFAQAVDLIVTKNVFWRKKLGVWKTLLLLMGVAKENYCRTRTVKKCLSPVFNETFAFQVKQKKMFDIINWWLLHRFNGNNRSHFAKDCLLTLVKSRLALGSLGWLFVTKPKMAEYTDK